MSIPPTSHKRYLAVIAKRMAPSQTARSIWALHFTRSLRGTIGPNPRASFGGRPSPVADLSLLHRRDSVADWSLWRKGNSCVARNAAILLSRRVLARGLQGAKAVPRLDHDVVKKRDRIRDCSDIFRPHFAVTVLDAEQALRGGESGDRRWAMKRIGWLGLRLLREIAGTGGQSGIRFIPRGKMD